MTVLTKAEQMKVRWGTSHNVDNWMAEVIRKSTDVVYGVDGLQGEDYSVAKFDDKTELYFRSTVENKNRHPRFTIIEFKDEENDRADAANAPWLSNTMKDAIKLAADAPAESQNVVIIAYLDQIRHGVSRDDATDMIQRMTRACKPGDNQMRSDRQSNNVLIPQPDLYSIFRSKVEYLPWLRLAAAELRDKCGVVIEADINGGELWVGLDDDYYEGNGDASDTILTIVNDVFLKYNLGSVHQEVDGIPNWEFADADGKMLKIVGNPYPSSSDDYAEFNIEL